MYCRQCKVEMKDTAKFCSRCGKKVGPFSSNENSMMRCPSCGEIYPGDSVFCVKDGTSLKPHSYQEKTVSLGTSSVSDNLSTPKIICLILASLVLIVLGATGYLYFSDRWIDIRILAKWFSPPLTQAKLANGEYYIDFPKEKVRLIDGGFERGNAPSDFISVGLDRFVFGDLNDDGVDDAGLILSSNTGGSGTFLEVTAVINRGGKPQQVASLMLGDRKIINSVAIKNGVIVVDMVTHGPNDPACCPTMTKVARFQLIGSTLVPR